MTDTLWAIFLVVSLVTGVACSTLIWWRKEQVIASQDGLIECQRQIISDLGKSSARALIVCDQLEVGLAQALKGNTLDDPEKAAQDYHQIAKNLARRAVNSNAGESTWGGHD